MMQLLGLPLSTSGTGQPFVCDVNGCQSGDPATVQTFRQLKQLINQAFVKLGYGGNLSDDGYIGNDVVSALGVLSISGVTQLVGVAMPTPSDVATNAPKITQALMNYLGLSPSSLLRRSLRPQITSVVSSAPSPSSVVPNPPIQTDPGSGPPTPWPGSTPTPGPTPQANTMACDGGLYWDPTTGACIPQAQIGLCPPGYQASSVGCVPAMAQITSASAFPWMKVAIGLSLLTVGVLGFKHFST